MEKQLLLPDLFSPILFLVALTTLVIGFVWYHPKVFGGVWMGETGLSEETLKKSNIFLIFGVTYLFSLFICLILETITIHQLGALGMIGGPAGANPNFTDPVFVEFYSKYGHAFRYFKHGALHGFIAGFMLALPIIAINALFERRSWKYIWIHAGYWFVCLTLMGGLICQFIGDKAN